MSEREIASADRNSFFVTFSKLHGGAIVTLHVKCA